MYESPHRIADTLQALLAAASSSISEGNGRGLVASALADGEGAGEEGGEADEVKLGVGNVEQGLVGDEKGESAAAKERVAGSRCEAE